MGQVGSKFGRIGLDLLKKEMGRARLGRARYWKSDPSTWAWARSGPNLEEPDLTLIRCRTVSKRFNLLTFHVDLLILTVNRIISFDSDFDSESDDVSHLIAAFLKLLQDLVLSKPDLTQTRSQNSLVRP
ncbi:hypothetical protein ACFX19_041196 [Malus domestica]